MTMLVPAKRGRGTAATLKSFATILRSVPGDWLEYPFGFRNSDAANSTIRNIRKGTASFPAGEFEAARSDNGSVRVLVRYIGG